MTETEQPALILITRPEVKANQLADLLTSMLEADAAELRIAPAQQTAPVENPDSAREVINNRSRDAQWLFVSAASVEHGLALMDSDTQASISGRGIAVGPATAAALQAHGIENIQIPADYRSEGLLRLPSLQAPETESSEVVIVNAEGGRQLLIHELGDRGFAVTEIHVYQRLSCTWPASLWEELVSASDLRVVATSAGAIRAAFDQRPRSQRRALREAHWVLPSERIQVICTGFGVTRITVAADASNQALAAAVEASLVKADTAR